MAAAAAGQDRAMPRVAVLAVALLVLAACEDAGGSADAFCDRARELEPQLQEVQTKVADLDESAVGALRELAEVAPSDVRQDIDAITEGESEDEVQEAVGNVEEALIEDCDVLSDPG